LDERIIKDLNEARMNKENLLKMRNALDLAT